jgi:hypothetical protein
MNGLITPDNFDFFARFLLAGWIIISTRSRFAVGERPKLAEGIAEAVVMSLINQLVFSLLSSLTGIIAPTANLPPRLSFYLEVIALPLCLGLIFGWNLSRGWNKSLLRWLSMPIQTARRRAYDHAFTKNRTEGFVIVTFSDGTKVHGYFGENSLAGSDPERSDIYLERLYTVGEDGQWFEQSPPRGALLDLTGLRSIEFLKTEGA